MKPGDIVRFIPITSVIRPTEESPYKLALLIEYKSWEKIATILHNGEVIRCRASHVTKAGKKDFLT